MLENGGFSGGGEGWGGGGDEIEQCPEFNIGFTGLKST